MHRSACVTLLAVLLAAPAGCFYTTSINDAPRADIEILGLGPYYPKSSVMLSTFRSSDMEDGDDLTCTWSAYSCADDRCAARSVLQDPSTIGCGETYDVFLPEGDHRPILVNLTAEDRDGGTFSDQEILAVGNRAPTLDGPQANFPGAVDRVPVSVPIQVSVVVGDPDGDDVALSWSLVKPRGGGADVELRPVGDDELTQEFTPDLADVWVVEVTADDSFPGGRVTSDAMIPVEEDQPPCIAETLPAADPERRFVLERADGPRTFSVLHVDDALDPYPRTSDEPYVGDSAFAWQLASPDTGGQLVPVAGAAGAELAIDPSTYAPGDLIDLRVEVSDRVAREIPCDQAQPTCSLSGDSCLQRVTWGVEIR
ncbi:MAG TPA: hypothetical protein VKB80_05730 [Kofleriaceae bacterium]|nr:hypothetical protein [Kofleriaceae bacterium]